MQRPARPVLRFVRAVLAVGGADREDGVYRARHETGHVALAVADVQLLQSAGVLGGDARRCTPHGTTSQWLKRQMLEEDAFAAQHRLPEQRQDGVTVNLAESPLARLAIAAAGEAAPFLSPHQVQAGERVRRLVERARLQPRVTMTYSGAHVAGGRGVGQASEISDLAADARQALGGLYRVLPRDCADVVLDVCGLEKGLQQIETERGWPRRSAKLVLRIGLDRLAEHFGLAEMARGAESGQRAWMDGERPAMFR